MNVIVADPGFKGLTGHHPASLELFFRAFGRERVQVFGHVSPDPELRDWAARHGLNVSWHFETYLYDGYRRDWSFGEAVPFIESLAADYRRLFRSLSASDEPACLLHHAADWPALAALARAVRTAGSRSLTHLVLLMFPPGGESGGGVSTFRRLTNYRLALAGLRTIPGVKLFVGSIEHLAAYHERLPAAQPYGLHPVFDFDPAASVRAAPDVPVLRRPALLYLGDAKSAKGFQVLPALASALLNSTDLPLQMQFGMDARLGAPEVRNAAIALRALQAGNQRLDLVEGYIPAERMAALLGDCRFVLFAYHPVAYAEQSSGLLWQAAAAGAPVVVIGESWLAREARRLCRKRRIFATLDAFVRELSVRGDLEFPDNPIDETYRATIFEPFEQFLARQAAGGVGTEPRYLGYEALAAPLRSDDGQGRVLFVDLALPDPLRSAGGYAAVQELALFRSLGFKVDFATLEQGHERSVPRFALEAAGVTLLIGESALSRHLSTGSTRYNLVFITRFNAAERMIPLIRKRLPQTKVWLNLADYHTLRFERAAAIAGGVSSPAEAASIGSRERAAARAVDLVLTYTAVEKHRLEQDLNQAVPVSMLPWVEAESRDPGNARPFSERRDICFLGGFRHQPNIDAMQWFVREILPAVRSAFPDMRLRIAGADMPDEVRALAAADVLVEGHVGDVSDLFGSCRLFVAPLRFGAGIKGKVISALRHGLPVVGTPIATEGIESTATIQFLRTVADDRGWVAAISALYFNEPAWTAANTAARQYVAVTYSFDSARATLQQILRGL